MPITAEGEMTRLETSASVTKRTAVFELPFKDAVMVADVSADTAAVEIENPPLLCPAGIVIELATVAAALFEPSVTTAPLPIAFEFNVTVPESAWPPKTALFASERLATATGFTVNDAVSV